MEFVNLWVESSLLFLAHVKLPELFISHMFLAAVEGTVTEIQAWRTVNETMSVRRGKKNSQQLQAESWGWDPSGSGTKVRGMVSVLNQFIPIERKSSALKKVDWHVYALERAF